jgi:hypothetical protein
MIITFSSSIVIIATFITFTCPGVTFITVTCVTLTSATAILATASPSPTSTYATSTPFLSPVSLLFAPSPISLSSPSPTSTSSTSPPSLIATSSPSSLFLPSTSSISPPAISFPSQPLPIVISISRLPQPFISPVETVFTSIFAIFTAPLSSISISSTFTTLPTFISVLFLVDLFFIATPCPAALLVNSLFFTCLLFTVEVAATFISALFPPAPFSILDFSPSLIFVVALQLSAVLIFSSSFLPLLFSCFRPLQVFFSNQFIFMTSFVILIWRLLLIFSFCLTLSFSFTP